MKISKVQINGFGNLANKNIDFCDGINLIRGSNESGKSTMIHFIKAMYYGINKNKSGKAFSELERFRPWNNNDFSGKIEYFHDGKKYLAYRDFNRNNCKVFDEFGSEITALFNKDKTRGVELGTEHLKVDEETFFNSVFISQGNSFVDANDRNVLIQKITNIFRSGDESVSFDKAKQKLKKILMDEVGTDRSHNRPINVVAREIETVEKMRDSLISNREKKDEIEERLRNIASKLESLEVEKNNVKKVLEIKERYANLIADREKEYEISLKLYEIEKEDKIVVRKKYKYSLIVLLTAILAIIALVLVYFNFYILALVPTISIFPVVFCINKFFSLNVSVNEPQNLETTKENFRRKEKKELSILNSEGISEKLTEKGLADVKKLAEEIQDNINNLLLEQHKLEYDNNVVSENVDRLNDVEEQLSDLLEKEECLRKLEYSVKLASSVLDESYEELKSDIVPHIEASIKKNIALTTNGKYLDTIYNDRLGLLVENAVGETVTIDKLSMGTIDQMYLGFRFAIAEKIGKVPLFMDESFAYFDDDRLENVLVALKEMSKDNQIFIMTCSDREKKILDKLNFDYNEIEI